jgi:hypothetical protein
MHFGMRFPLPLIDLIVLEGILGVSAAASAGSVLVVVRQYLRMSDQIQMAGHQSFIAAAATAV